MSSSCPKCIAIQQKNIVHKNYLHKGIAKMVYLVEYFGSSKETRLFCNTHIWVLKNSLIVAI